MTSYFAHSDRQTLLAAVAGRWLGTPFQGHQRVAGAGVDCVQLAAALYHETGLIPAIPDFGRYTMDGGKHSAVDVMTEWLLGSPHFALVWSGRSGYELPAVGDLLCLHLGRQPWHCAVMMGAGEIIEVHHDSKVALRPLADPTWSRRVTSIWRPISP